MHNAGCSLLTPISAVQEQHGLLVIMSLLRFCCKGGTELLIDVKDVQFGLKVAAKEKSHKKLKKTSIHLSIY